LFPDRLRSVPAPVRLCFQRRTSSAHLPRSQLLTAKVGLRSRRPPPTCRSIRKVNSHAFLPSKCPKPPPLTTTWLAALAEKAWSCGLKPFEGQRAAGIGRASRSRPSPSYALLLNKLTDLSRRLFAVAGPVAGWCNHRPATRRLSGPVMLSRISQIEWPSSRPFAAMPGNRRPTKQAVRVDRHASNRSSSHPALSPSTSRSSPCRARLLHTDRRTDRSFSTCRPLIINTGSTKSFGTMIPRPPPTVTSIALPDMRTIAAFVLVCCSRTPTL
jgi:hypothetical protein